MITVRACVAAIALAAATVCAGGAAAEATPLQFTMTGDLDYSWTMDSDPIPFDAESETITFKDTKPGTSFLLFYGALVGGGLVGFDDGKPFPDYIFSYAGPVIFTAPDMDDPVQPHFSIGTYVLTTDRLTGQPANEVLKITALATAPIPAALPLFASALGGLGFAGWRRRKKTQTAT